MFPVLRSIPSCNTDMNLRSCILNRHKMRKSQIATIQESLPSHFVICRILWSWPWRHTLSPITLKTCSGYLVEYPCSLLTWIWKVSFLPILALFHCYICLCVCISVIKPIMDLQRKPYWQCPTSMCTCFLYWRVYPLALRTWILRSCILNRHKMRQSQIATIQESLPSLFVICRILWSWPWRHTLSPITLKTCSVYLGENPGSLLTSIWKVAFLPILVLFHWYICLCVCLSVIKLIIDVPRKPCWKGPILMWTCVLHLGVHPRLLWNLSKQLCFESSQNATVTNCDNSGILAVAFCDLSHFVIMAVTAHTESNNTENVFWVLGRVPRFTFDMNMKSFIFAHFGVISLLYLFVCMYISYKAHNRFTKETLLIVSDVDVYMFPVLRSIPSCTTDINLRSCILNRHKMRQSQIATIQESLPSHFVICRILWSWPWRHKLSPITLKTCYGYLGEYPGSLLTWIWKVSFLPILALFHCYICLCVCISVIKPIIDLQRKPYW